ncbi:MAG: carbohydrate porin, partial [Candidatus Acidiferrales bacterium]
MAGQMAGLDFYGNQVYGGSYLIEPIDYAYGNLFSTTYESFNPAGTPAAQARVVIWKTLYVRSAVLSGNRNPYVQDTNGFHFKIADSPVFAFETGYSRHSEYLNGQTGDFDKKLYPSLYKFGATYNAGKFTDAFGNVSRGNYLIYGSVNQAIYRERAGSSHGVDG